MIDIDFAVTHIAESAEGQFEETSGGKLDRCIGHSDQQYDIEAFFS